MGLHSALVANELTPEQMLGGLTIACNALTASGADAPIGSKDGVELALSAATTQGTRICDSCNGRGTIENTSHNASGRYGRGGGRGNGRGRGRRSDEYGGRDQDRSNYSNWRHGGRGDGRSSENNRRDDYARNYETHNRGDGRGRTNFGNNRRRGEGGRGDG